MRTPILNGVLQSDLDGANFRITPLSGLEITAKTVKEVCLGIRTGGAPGSGSWDDPFDASTAEKHDTIWREKIAPFPGTIVRYRDGLFLTTGSASFNADNGYFLPTGVRVIGSGMFETIIQATAYPVAAGATGHYVFEGVGLTGVGSEVSDLTVDCNWQNLGAAAGTMAGGVLLGGNDCRIMRVRCINAYGNLAANAPAKGLAITAYYIPGFGSQTSTNPLIEDCLLELFRGDFGTAISIFATGGGAGGSLMTGGNVRRNLVRNWFGGTAFSALGVVRLHLLDNIVTDTDSGIIIPADTFDDCRIARNQFVRVNKLGASVAPITGSLSVQNLVVEDNYIELSGDFGHEAFTGINIFGQADNVMRNARLSRNTIVMRGPPGVGGDLGIHATRVNGLIIEGNVENNVNDNTIETNCTGVTIRDNFDEAGAHPVNLSDYSSITSGAPPVPNLFNTLRSAGTRTIDGGKWAYNIPFTDYVIQSGDTLQMEVFGDHANSSMVMQTALLTDIAGHVVLGETTMKDQNGLVGYADLTAYADSRWYFRTFSLEAYVGTTVKAFEFGGAGADENGNPAIAAGSIYYWRNVRLVSSDGLSIRRRIYTDDTITGAVGVSPGVLANATSVSATPAWPAQLFAANTDTGWTADTGTAEKTAHATYTAASISNPPTQAQVQAIANALQSVTRSQKALKDALIARGILSA